MMGDSTITEQKTFDPQKINNYLEKINEKLTKLKVIKQANKMLILKPNIIVFLI